MTVLDLVEALAEVAGLVRQTRAELDALRRSHREAVNALGALAARLAALEAREDEVQRWVH